VASTPEELLAAYGWGPLQSAAGSGWDGTTGSTWSASTGWAG
jgi:hypothetical protein